MTGRPNRGTGVPSDPSRSKANGFDKRHPPFEPGNTIAAVRHGADSDRVVAARARLVKAGVLEQAPWLDEPIFANAVERYCRAEARAQLLSDWIFSVAEQKGPAKVAVRLWESAVASDRAASQLAAELGITPLSRARLAALDTTTKVGQSSLVTQLAAGARRRTDAAKAAAIEAHSDQEGDDHD
jgi:hypothetical protein